MELEADYSCAYCGETIATRVDASAGRHQSYTEDCQVCCRPNLLRIEIWDDGSGDLQARVDAEPESDWE
ncbi:MAG: CPXCG motif-containing cysteine-rich protein [Sumerlaeia bacterium]